MGIKQDLIAGLGEFTGTTLFLLLALGGAKTAQFTRTTSQTEGLETALGNQTIMFIAVSFGISLLVTAWCFYRVTGGLFNPAITLALYLIGGLGAFRAALLVVSQIAGGIAGAALVAALTPFGGASTVTTTLGTGVNIGQGVFIEAFLTAILILTVLFLAAEKHKSTYLAPLGIGLVLLSCHLFGVAWTGCGINPARSFGPAVVSGSFPGYHWIYWVGPMIGALMAVSFYLMLKAFDYTSVVFGQDADHEIVQEGAEKQSRRHLVGSTLFKRSGKKLVVFHARKTSNDDATKASGVTGEEALSPAKVVPYDADDADMRDALCTGQASMLDPSDAEQGLSAIAADAGITPGAATKGNPDLAESQAGALPPMVVTPDANTMSGTGASQGLLNGVPSMRAEAQDVGGIQAPGTLVGG